MLLAHAFLVACANADFAAKGLYSTYDISYPWTVVWGPGFMPDENACIATYAYWNAEIQAAPESFYVIGVEYVGFSGSHPYICSHNNIRPDGSKSPDNFSIQQTAYWCPANSTANASGRCNCNVGFLQQENSCVRLELKFLEPNSCKRQDGLLEGQPVVPATGEKYRSETDWSDAGPSPLTFTRTYRSGWAADARHLPSGMGVVWSHTIM